MNFPETVSAYSPNAHQTIQIPVLVKHKFKSDIQNILLLQPKSPRVDSSFNNYLENNDMTAISNHSPRISPDQTPVKKSLFSKEAQPCQFEDDHRTQSKSPSPKILLSGRSSPMRENSSEKRSITRSTLSKDLDIDVSIN